MDFPLGVIGSIALHDLFLVQRAGTRFSCLGKVAPTSIKPDTSDFASATARLVSGGFPPVKEKN